MALIPRPMSALRNPDPQLGLPLKITLQPTILVRNTTSKNISTDITLNWRGDSGKRPGEAVHGATGALCNAAIGNLGRCKSSWAFLMMPTGLWFR